MLCIDKGVTDGGITMLPSRADLVLRLLNTACKAFVLSAAHDSNQQWCAGLRRICAPDEVVTRAESLRCRPTETTGKKCPRASRFARHASPQRTGSAGAVDSGVAEASPCSVRSALTSGADTPPRHGT